MYLVSQIYILERAVLRRMPAQIYILQETVLRRVPSQLYFQLIMRQQILCQQNMHQHVLVKQTLSTNSVKQIVCTKYVNQLCVSKLCEETLWPNYVNKLCVNKFYVDKLCQQHLCQQIRSKNYVTKLCVNKLCQEIMSRIPANAIQCNPVAFPNIHTWKSSPETLSLQYVYSVRISPKTGPWCLPYTSLMLLSCLPYVFRCLRMSLICFPCVPNNMHLYMLMRVVARFFCWVGLWNGGSQHRAGRRTTMQSDSSLKRFWCLVA